MDNTTRLLERHADQLASRTWALVNAGDTRGPGLPGCVYSHADRALSAAVDVRMLPALPGDIDLIVVVLPKSLEQLEFLLASLAGQLGDAVELWLVGPTRGGIKGGVTRLKKWAAEVRAVDSARHCKLVSARLAPAPFHLADWAQHFDLRVDDGSPVTVVSYPGVFNHGALDEGTALLLEAMSADIPSGPVVDIGCGAGVISMVLARAGARVTAVDVSATAVAATAATARANGLSVEVCQGDLYDALPAGQQFSALVTNPPFHDGSERTLAITRRLIESAPRWLVPDGQLWLVANQGLAYQDWLQAAFARVQVVRETSRFRVYRAWRR